MKDPTSGSLENFSVLVGVRSFEFRWPCGVFKLLLIIPVSGLGEGL